MVLEVRLNLGYVSELVLNKKAGPRCFHSAGECL